MADDDSDSGMVVARIQIERRITQDGDDNVFLSVDDGSDDGDTPSMTELLGMLELSKDSILRGLFEDDD